MAALIRGQAGKILGTFGPLLQNGVVKGLTPHHSLSRGYVLLCSVQTPHPRNGKSFHSIRLSSTTTETTPEKALVKAEEKKKEKFIPITRRSIIRHLVQEKDFLTDKEQRQFERLSLALDAAIVNRHHVVLQELKSLFDPINPDKDTIATRELNRREKLDNEFWLLQKLEAIMEKANFRLLPKDEVRKSLEEHKARNGVIVSVDPNKYDVLTFWALGRESPPVTVTTWQKVLNMVLKRPLPTSTEYFKRVVLACRLKRDDKLLLKAFKEVPVNALEQTLPDGKITMAKLDKGVINTSLIIAGGGILAKIVTILAGIHVDWTLLATAATGLIGIQAWTHYKNKHLGYLNEHSRMMFFKNIANNRGLLTLLVDRAEDEVFKEALLVYSFLLTNRPPSAFDEIKESDLGGISQLMLERRIEEWVKEKTGCKVEFESDEAVKLLREFGILSEDINGDFYVLPMDASLRNLPQTARSITDRIEEYDIVEGYDRDILDEQEEEYKSEDTKRKKYGWF